MGENGYTVQSVAKAVQLLEHLAHARFPLSLQELSGLTGWPKSTVYGLLSTLRDHSMVEQSRLDGKYQLGVRLFELGNAVSQSWDITRVSRPHMQQIALQTGECVHLAMLAQNEVLYLDSVDTGLSVQVVAAKGARAPVHCTALGKVLLAYLPPARAQSLLQSAGLAPSTPHTITDLPRMQKELLRIRQEGFAIENGEYRIGLRSVAAPVFDVSGSAVYAVSVTGMFRQITNEAFLLAQRLVLQAAKDISADLGYRPATN